MEFGNKVWNLGGRLPAIGFMGLVAGGCFFDGGLNYSY